MASLPPLQLDQCVSCVAERAACRCVGNRSGPGTGSSGQHGHPEGLPGTHLHKHTHAPEIVDVSRFGAVPTYSFPFVPLSLKAFWETLS